MKELLTIITEYQEVRTQLEILTQRKNDLQQRIMDEMQKVGVDTIGNNETGKATIVYREQRSFLNGEPAEYAAARDRMNEAQQHVLAEKERMAQIEKDAETNGEVLVTKIPNYPKITSPKKA